MYVLFFFITSTEIKTVLLGRNWPVQDGVYCAGKLSAEAEAEVYLLKCKANSRKVWLRHKLEVEDPEHKVKCWERSGGNGWTIGSC